MGLVWYIYCPNGHRLAVEPSGTVALGEGVPTLDVLDASHREREIICPVCKAVTRFSNADLKSAPQKISLEPRD